MWNKSLAAEYLVYSATYARTARRILFIYLRYGKLYYIV
jgi:hypothetical protein